MAYQFNPYLSLPARSTSNPFFISTSKGGFSHCIVRNSAGYTLPNCVALVHAEWLQILTSALGPEKAREYESKLCRNNASVYWGYTSDGFKRGQTPKLGAIACWSGGKSGAGHVAFVTSFDSAGNWSGVASNYSGSAFYRCSYKKSNNYYLGSLYKFQGFIYPPIDFSNYCINSVGRSSKQDQIRISTDVLNVRTGPDEREYKSLGYAEPGYYNVLETKKGAKFTWYEVEKDKWVANVGDKYVTFYPKEKPAIYDVTFRVSAGDVAGLKEYGAKVIQVTPTVTEVKS